VINMSNPNPIIKIGRDLNPVELGRRGGKSKRIETEISRELRKLRYLDSEEYLKKVEIINPETNQREEMFQIFLAGPKGFKWYILRKISDYCNILTRSQEEIRKRYQERGDVEFNVARDIKEEIEFLLKVWEQLYGKQPENNTYSIQNSEVWAVKQEVNNILQKKEPNEVEIFREELAKIREKREENNKLTNKY